MSPDRVGLDSELNLRRLLLVRIATGVVLLAPTLYLQLLSGTEASLTPLYGLIGALFGVSVVFAVAHRVFGRRSAFVAVQLTIDVALATALVYALGGVQSPVVMIYLIIAFAAGIMTPRQTALTIACWNGVAYGLMAHLAARGWLPHWASTVGPQISLGPADMYLRIFSLLLVSCAVALVSGHYSSRLRRARRDLREQASALEAMQQLNEQLLAGMSSGLVAADASGTIVACNRAAERITQRSRAEIIGHSVSEILALDEASLADLEQRLRARQIYRTERQFSVGSGEVRTVGMSVTRVVEAPGPMPGQQEASSTDPGRSPGGPWKVHAEGPIAGGYIFMFQDLTDIKRMERLFWMRERMAVLGEMASSLAHEIRNPLGAISGSLQLLHRGDVPASSEHGDRLMAIVTAESERLSVIIENFLDYARPEKLEASESDLVRLACETVELLQNSPEVTAAHKISVVGDSAVLALVDPGRIKQVFWNMARNSVQAMPRGGTLRIELVRTEGGARVIFADNGPGMSAEQVEKVFRPFVSESASGTGLGLAVVYRIVQMHGAQVQLESEPGRGTRFVLRFDDAAVPTGGDDMVVVERDAERHTRVFDELSRSVRAE